MEKESHVKDLSEFNIIPFEIVACNFYPFERDPEIVNIDIGGPAMARCAAKNHKRVTILVDSADYDQILDELRRDNKVKDETRQRLAIKAFRASIRHDESIVSFLESSQTQ